MGDEVARHEDATSSRALERVSDADRERAADFVQAALSDGLIGLDEIDERVGAVMSARTRGDLEAALIHLPGADAALATPRQAVPATSGDEPTTIGGTHARLERTGHWTVPAHLVVTLAYSSLELDLMEAELPGPEILVEVDLTHSRLRVVVPDDIRVVATGLEQNGSRVRIESPDDPPSPRAVIRLTGPMNWGRISVGAPGRRRRRQLRRAGRPPS